MFLNVRCCHIPFVYMLVKFVLYLWKLTAIYSKPYRITVIVLFNGVRAPCSNSGGSSLYFTKLVLIAAQGLESATSSIPSELICISYGTSIPGKGLDFPIFPSNYRHTWQNGLFNFCKVTDVVERKFWIRTSFTPLKKLTEICRIVLAQRRWVKNTQCEPARKIEYTLWWGSNSDTTASRIKCSVLMALYAGLLVTRSRIILKFPAEKTH